MIGTSNPPLDYSGFQRLDPWTPGTFTVLHSCNTLSFFLENVLYLSRSGPRFRTRAWSLTCRPATCKPLID